MSSKFECCGKPYFIIGDTAIINNKEYPIAWFPNGGASEKTILWDGSGSLISVEELMNDNFTVSQYPKMEQLKTLATNINLYYRISEFSRRFIIVCGDTEVPTEYSNALVNKNISLNIDEFVRFNIKSLLKVIINDEKIPDEHIAEISSFLRKHITENNNKKPFPVVVKEKIDSNPNISSMDLVTFVRNNYDGPAMKLKDGTSFDISEQNGKKYIIIDRFGTHPELIYAIDKGSYVIPIVKINGSLYTLTTGKVGDARVIKLYDDSVKVDEMFGVFVYFKNWASGITFELTWEGEDNFLNKETAHINENDQISYAELLITVMLKNKYSGDRYSKDIKRFMALF